MKDCTIPDCNKKCKKGNICYMHKTRWNRHKSYDDPRKEFKNNPNHGLETIKICKKHGDLEHNNIYFLKNSNHMLCKICQSSNKKKRIKQNKLEENYLKERKYLTELLCGQCKEIKPIKDFTSYWLKRKHPMCKPCKQQYSRKSLLKLHFDMTIEEYEKKLEEQNGVCDICGMAERMIHPVTKKVASLCVDHNHKTDKNRGLLCQLCNFGIGYFKDSPDLLRKAAFYLEKHEET